MQSEGGDKDTPHGEGDRNNDECLQKLDSVTGSLALLSNSLLLFLCSLTLAPPFIIFLCCSLMTLFYYHYFKCVYMCI